MNKIERHRCLTEKMLFDYYLVSSSRENEILSPFPYNLDKEVFDAMTHEAEVLDSLVQRLIPEIIHGSKEIKLRFDSFPYCEQILNSRAPIMPFFWVRYDAFERDSGGIFFSEFNYDKPCGQREIALSDLVTPERNPNGDFRRRFLQCFLEQLYSAHLNPKEITVAIMMDPSHYEELHLAQLYMDMLEPAGCNIIIAGNQNLYVKDESVFAFNQKIDVILRQYPVEYFYEINDIEEIVRLFDEGKVQIINDPRAIIGQTKSLFACLWEMAEKNDPFLTEKEVHAIRETIPYTRYFSRELVSELIQNKDLHVIKAAFGRYSEEVYIGKMCTPEEWQEVIDYVLQSEKLHIVQEFCQIKREIVYKFDYDSYAETEAFGNFGIYLANGRFSGVCVRWSTDYLSLDEVVWVSPVGVRKHSLKLITQEFADRDVLWQQINTEAAFRWGYTGGYTGNVESFSTQVLELPSADFEEIKSATGRLTDIFRRTTDLVRENLKVFGPVLGVSESLYELIEQDRTSAFTFFGRLDWVYDTNGRLKLLELNSETPAGLIEATVLTDSILERINTDKPISNPNIKLKELIKDAFNRITADYEEIKEIKNIGVVSSCYYEDWYNTMTLFEIIKDSKYNFLIGEVSGIEVKDDKIYLYGQQLDAIYGYYPLDWFDTDPYYSGVIGAFEKGTFSIIPPSTHINQSKAFFALIWELLDNKFYSKEDAEIIERYIPRTALSAKKLASADFCIKPYYGHEGQQIQYSIGAPFKQDEGTEFVYQNRVDLQPVQLKVCTTKECFNQPIFPVIGAYIADDSFAGIYTRAGGRITDNHAVFIPVVVSDNVTR